MATINMGFRWCFGVEHVWVGFQAKALPMTTALRPTGITTPLMLPLILSTVKSFPPSIANSMGVFSFFHMPVSELTPVMQRVWGLTEKGGKWTEDKGLVQRDGVWWLTSYGMAFRGKLTLPCWD